MMEREMSKYIEATTQVNTLKLEKTSILKQSKISFKPKSKLYVKMKEDCEKVDKQLVGGASEIKTNSVISDTEGGSNQKAVNATIAEVETEIDQVVRDSTTDRLTMVGDSDIKKLTIVGDSTTDKLTGHLDQTHTSQMQDKITFVNGEANLVNVIDSSTVTVTNRTESQFNSISNSGEFNSVENVGNISAPLSDNATLLSVMARERTTRLPELPQKLPEMFMYLHLKKQ